MSSAIKFISGGEELLPKIKPLWKLLNENHMKVSRYFSDDFNSFTFEHRVSKLIKEYQQGKIRVDIAIGQHIPIGYIIGGIREDNIGEIESIFIHEKHRGMSLGKELMNLCLGWLNAAGVENIIITVAVGNEAVLPFYEKFGFFPRVYTLKYKKYQNPS